jgi:hypothetical protein
MSYVYNPLLGAGLDQTGAGGGGGTPGGSDTQVQFNDGGAFGGDADLTWNKTTNVLTNKGDINLDDGGTFTTTVQTVTPTANRTISFPDATGTVALVAGSSGQLLWNNAGAQAGASTLTYDGSILTTSGRFINSYNATASNPAKVFTGTWFTGGTSTTTKPHFLVEPTGTTSTAWSTSGTGLGVNAASGFAGNLLDLQVNGTSQARISGTGNITSTNFTVTRIGSEESRLEIFSNGGFSGFSLAGNTLTLANTNNHDVVVPGCRFQRSPAGLGIFVTNGVNFSLGTTTGTKIGTTTTQKLGFYNATPVVQPTAVADATDAASVITQLNALLARMRDLGLIAT